MLTTHVVRRHEHRHHNPLIPRHPVLGDYSREQRRPNQPAHVLGHSLRHGTRRQLWRLQRRLQRFAGRTAMEGHPCQEVYPRPRPRLCTREPTHHRHRDECGLPCARRRGVNNERHFSIYFVIPKLAYSSIMEQGGNRIAAIRFMIATAHGVRLRPCLTLDLVAALAPPILSPHHQRSRHQSMSPRRCHWDKRPSW